MRYYTPPIRRRTGRLLRMLALLVLVGAFVFQVMRYLRRLTEDMALSSVSDVLLYAVNDAVGRCMDLGEYSYDEFVSLEQDDTGAVTALTTNMVEVNALSSEILKEVVTATERGAMDIHLPLGSLLGSTFLMGKGPAVTVRIVPLTSSHVEIRNELTSAGINQTRHRILLEVDVDVTVLLPWSTADTRVSCQVLIAETVVVGSVPQSYFHYGETEAEHDP